MNAAAKLGSVSFTSIYCHSAWILSFVVPFFSLLVFRAESSQAGVVCWQCDICDLCSVCSSDPGAQSALPQGDPSFDSRVRVRSVTSRYGACGIVRKSNGALVRSDHERQMVSSADNPLVNAKVILLVVAVVEQYRLYKEVAIIIFVVVVVVLVPVHVAASTSVSLATPPIATN